MITKEDMHNFYFQYIVREDLDGDPLLSLNLLEAAEDKDWQRVEALLEQGADPRICRSTDNNCVESALVMALAARRYDIAKKLYDAGDRLDDHEGFTDAEWDGEIIDFFASEMRRGRNYFLDDSKSFDELCRTSNFARINEILHTAEKVLESGNNADRHILGADLNSGFIELIHTAIQHPREIAEYIPTLEKMLDYGAVFYSKKDVEELTYGIKHDLFIRLKEKTLIDESKTAQEKLLTIVKKTPIVCAD